MKRILALFVVSVTAMAFAGCESSIYNAKNDAGIDPISRNVDRTQGSSLQDRATMNAPPIRRGYVEDR
jgi:hypothetical protein